MAVSSLQTRKRATTILLIGSTGHGKSTLGNFLLYPDEKYQTQRELQPFRTGTCNRPETQHVVAKSNSKSTLHVIDTPGLNESSEKDLEHMIEIVRSLREAESITACILCIKFDSKIDAQYKSTIAYFKKLLPRLFEGNVLIVLTNYATDKRSVRMREMQGIDVVGVVRNTVEEVVRRGFLSFEPQVFLIDSLPLDLDPSDREQSENTREAILDYVDTMYPITLNNLRVAKTDALRQHDEKKIEALNGEIHGYNVRLKQVNAKAEKALERIEEIGKKKSHVARQLKQSKENREEYDTLDLATVAEWSLRKKWKPFRWQSECFSRSCKPCPLITHTRWDNGHLKWLDIAVTNDSVSGRVEGEFSRGLYANVSLKSYRKEKYRKHILELEELIQDLEKEVVRLDEVLVSYRTVHQEYLSDIELLQNYIDDKNAKMTELSPEYMSLEEAEKAFSKLLH